MLDASCDTPCNGNKYALSFGGYCKISIYKSNTLKSINNNNNLFLNNRRQIKV